MSRNVPTELKVLRGTTGKTLRDHTRATRRAKGSAQALAVIVAPPPGVLPPYPYQTKPRGVGRRMWRIYWTKCTWVSEADISSVVRLCALWDQWDEIRRELDAKPHRLGAWLNVGEQMLKIEIQLGLTPVSRSAIRVAQAPEGSSLDDWQKRRAERSAATN